MKKKFNLKNILLVSFLAMAGIFGISSAVIGGQKATEQPVMEKADAAYWGDWDLIIYHIDGTTSKFDMYQNGSGDEAMYAGAVILAGESCRVYCVTNDWNYANTRGGSGTNYFTSGTIGGYSVLTCNTSGSFDFYFNVESRNGIWLNGTADSNLPADRGYYLLSNDTSWGYSGAPQFTETTGDNVAEMHNVLLSDGFEYKGKALLKGSNKTDDWTNYAGINDNCVRDEGATVYAHTDNPMGGNSVIDITSVYDLYWTSGFQLWTALHIFTVTLDPGSGSGGDSSVTDVVYGEAMPSISVPSRTGYDFAGYYTGENGTGTKYYNADGSSATTWAEVTADTLYAYWTAKTYTVTKGTQTNGTLTVASSGTFASGLSISWAPGSDAGYTYTFSSVTVKNGATTLATYSTGTSATYTMSGTYYSSVTINLSYTKTAHTFSIAYNNNGGSGTMTNTTGVTYNTASSLKSNGFTRGGHVFKEWNTQADGKGTSYNPGSITALQVNALYPGTNGGTRTLYAIWTSGEGAAITYATNFNTSIGGTCVYAGGTNVDDLATAWSAQDTAYDALADHVKYWLDSSHASSNANVTAMFAKYDYVYGKYGSDIGEDFLDREPASSSAYRGFGLGNIFGSDDNNITTIIIVVASSVALLSVTALSILVIKKRKQKEE